MNEQNRKYWRDKKNEKEDSGKYDNETAVKYKSNVSTYGIFIVFIIILVLIVIAIVL